MNEKKGFWIEEHKVKGGGGFCYHRFVSLINGTKGQWKRDKKDAISQGEAHVKFLGDKGR
jgi:hypothetical protein